MTHVEDTGMAILYCKNGGENTTSTVLVQASSAENCAGISVVGDIISQGLFPVSKGT
jgi:hypothetical protein